MALSITSVTSISPTKVKIDLNQIAVANDAFLDPGNYVVTSLNPGGVDVIVKEVVLPPGQAFPKFLVLRTTEHTEERDYEVYIKSAVTSASLEPSDQVAVGYEGKGVSPVVLLVKAVANDLVSVTFDEYIDQNSSARDPSNYVWDHGITTTAVLSVSRNVVILQTSGHVPGELYVLTIYGVASFSLVFADSPDLVDGGIFVEMDYERLGEESLSESDVITTEMDYTRTLADSASMSDVAIVGETLLGDESDSITMTDTLTSAALDGLTALFIVGEISSSGSYAENVAFSNYLIKEDLESAGTVVTVAIDSTVVDGSEVAGYSFYVIASDAVLPEAVRVTIRDTDTPCIMMKAEYAEDSGLGVWHLGLVDSPGDVSLCNILPTRINALAGVNWGVNNYLWRDSETRNVNRLLTLSAAMDDVAASTSSFSRIFARYEQGDLTVGGTTNYETFYPNRVAYIGCSEHYYALRKDLRRITKAYALWVSSDPSLDYVATKQVVLYVESDTTDYYEKSWARVMCEALGYGLSVLDVGSYTAGHVDSYDMYIITNGAGDNILQADLDDIRTSGVPGMVMNETIVGDSGSGDYYGLATTTAEASSYSTVSSLSGVGDIASSMIRRLTGSTVEARPFNDNRARYISTLASTKYPTVAYSGSNYYVVMADVGHGTNDGGFSERTIFFGTGHDDTPFGAEWQRMQMVLFQWLTFEVQKRAPASSVLYIIQSGSPFAVESAIADQVIGEGHSVTYLADSSYVAGDEDSYDLWILGHASVLSGSAEINSLINSTVPGLVMTNGYIANAVDQFRFFQLGGVLSSTSVDFTSPRHPIAENVGFFSTAQPQTVTIISPSSNIYRGQNYSSGTQFAQLGGSNYSAIHAWDAGEDSWGSVYQFPAKRGWFGPWTFAQTGIEYRATLLFRSMITWLLGGLDAEPALEFTFDQTIDDSLGLVDAGAAEEFKLLFLTGSSVVSAAEAAMASDIVTALPSVGVYFVQDSSITAGIMADYDGYLASETTGFGTNATYLRDSGKPGIICEQTQAVDSANTWCMTNNAAAASSGSCRVRGSFCQYWTDGLEIDGETQLVGTTALWHYLNNHPIASGRVDVTLATTVETNYPIVIRFDVGEPRYNPSGGASTNFDARNSFWGFGVAHQDINQPFRDLFKEVVRWTYQVEERTPLASCLVIGDSGFTIGDMAVRTMLEGAGIECTMTTHAGFAVGDEDAYDMWCMTYDGGNAIASAKVSSIRDSGVPGIIGHPGYVEDSPNGSWRFCTSYISSASDDQFYAKYSPMQAALGVSVSTPLNYGDFAGQAYEYYVGYDPSQTNILASDVIAESGDAYMLSAEGGDHRVSSVGPTGIYMSARTVAFAPLRSPLHMLYYGVKFLVHSVQWCLGIIGPRSPSTILFIKEASTPTAAETEIINVLTYDGHAITQTYVANYTEGDEDAYDMWMISPAASSLSTSQIESLRDSTVAGVVMNHTYADDGVGKFCMFDAVGTQSTNLGRVEDAELSAETGVPTAINTILSAASYTIGYGTTVANGGFSMMRTGTVANKCIALFRQGGQRYNAAAHGVPTLFPAKRGFIGIAGSADTFYVDGRTVMRAAVHWVAGAYD